jgi:subtilase family serine protease
MSSPRHHAAHTTTQVSAHAKAVKLTALLVAMGAAGFMLHAQQADTAAARSTRPVRAHEAAIAQAAKVLTPAMVSPFGAMPTNAAAPNQTAGASAATALAPEQVAAATAVADTAHGRTMASQDATAPELEASAQGVKAPAGLKDLSHPPLYATPVAAPSDMDADGQASSAALPPARVNVPTSYLTTPRKSQINMGSAGGDTGRSNTGSNTDSTDTANGGGLNWGNLGLGEVGAAAATTTVSVVTPAQVRQTYGFAALPAATTANKAAYQGSGQVIVIIDAFHHAAAGADLNTFSTKFGLPTCTLLPNTYKAGTPIASLVTPPKPGEGCSFQTLYTTSAGTQAASAPRADSGWAMEIALDVQWAHAMAPMAKIVLVEAPSNGGTDLINAMVFASKLNASSVSMSFGAKEFNGAATTAAYMVGTATWVAASGDWGTGAYWPAVSRNVLSVGGTLLNNLSPRAETAWSGSGGAIALYEPMPTWQAGVSIPGNPANTPANASKMRRGVPDVAYNASPSSGVYVLINGGWYAVGGTSAGSPQWAALVAVVNGARTLAGKAPFTGTGFQTALYGSAASSANYKATFLDISSGTNGTCKTCAATTGYDLVTGLGTPHAQSLVNTLVAVK